MVITILSTGDMVRAYLSSNGLTVSDLIRENGLSRETVNFFMEDKIKMPSSVAIGMHSLLPDISEEFLIGYDAKYQLQKVKSDKWAGKTEKERCWFKTCGTNGINSVTNAGTNVGTNKNLSAGEHQVYDLLSSNPKLTIGKLSGLTGKSARTIQRTLNALVNKGSIVRIGKTRGYWEIIK